MPRSANAPLARGPLEQLYAREGLPLRVVAAQLGAGVGRVVSSLDHHKIPRRRHRYPTTVVGRRPSFPLTEDKLRRLYVDECRSIGEIASAYGLTKPRVWRRLGYHGIPTRAASYHHREAITRDQLVALYVGKQLTIPEVAARLGVGVRRVSQAMRAHGVLARPGGYRGTAAVVPRAHLEQLYIAEGLSQLNVGRQLGVDWRVVRRSLAYHGIPVRPRWGEPVDVDELRRLYVDEGLTVTAIAERTGRGWKLVANTLTRAGVYQPRRSRSSGAI